MLRYPSSLRRPLTYSIALFAWQKSSPTSFGPRRRQRRSKGKGENHVTIGDLHLGGRKIYDRAAR